MKTKREILAPPQHPETTAQAAITTQALAAEDLLEQAFHWLCQRRKDWPPNADVWHFRRDWLAEKAHIQKDLLAGTYVIGLLIRERLAKKSRACAEEITEYPVDHDARHYGISRCWFSGSVWP